MFSKPTVTVGRSESLNEKSEARTSVRRAHRYDSYCSLTCFCGLDRYCSVMIVIVWSMLII